MARKRHAGNLPSALAARVTNAHRSQAVFSMGTGFSEEDRPEPLFFHALCSLLGVINVVIRSTNGNGYLPYAIAGMRNWETCSEYAEHSNVLHT
ncbi:hypothetical protein DPMN_105362 [Dreissena polymorpha]|uniref:Uncharacterized protein n=1 Tax=Dreissena polymorpha TaxID=45954 RepID=A0A9D4K0V4_DREPO|nr:hypothetical protein DPMN_105362 [Dreissena polymorpha]